MNVGYAILILNFFYVLIFAFLFFTKKKIDNIETKIFTTLIISNLIGIALEFLCGYFIKHLAQYPILTFIVNKFHIVNISFWITIFTVYVLIVCFGYDKIKEKSKPLIFYLYLGLIFLLVYLLPIKYFNAANKIYSYGLATELVVILSVIYLIIDIYAILKNIHKLDKTKLFPLIILIMGMIIVFVLRSINPTLILITTIFSFVTVIMYTTIENPDIKMVNQLELAIANAEKASRAKDKFLASMSHEIRTPLNAIVGFSNLIAEAQSLDEALENANEIVKSSDILLTMVDNALDIVQLDSNKLISNNVDYNPEKEFSKVIDLFKDKIKTKSLDLDVQIATMPNVLNGDIDNIKRIMANLLDNAIKYTEKGSIKVKINGKKNNDKYLINLIIEDTGAGIAQDLLPKIFDNFTRDAKYKDSNIPGMGLGLPITKRLVDLLDGKISCQSIEGKGTTFKVSLWQSIR